jgi:hypothetical protein
MNIAIPLTNFNIQSLSFSDPIKNNLIQDATFIRLFYFTSSASFNGLHIFFQLNNVISEKYFNKNKYSFNVYQNYETINRLKQMEEKILSQYNNNNNSSKKPLYKISEYIQEGNIKTFQTDVSFYTSIFILKISGIWENNEYMGLTFKFLKWVSPSIS